MTRVRAPLVLVGMSAHEVGRQEELALLAAPLGALVAHLQVGDPSLRLVLDALADTGAAEVRLVGIATSRFAPGVSWLRRVAAAWWREQADPPSVLVGERLVCLADPAEDPTADPSADLAAVVAEGLRAIGGREAGLTSPAWEEAPQHRRQVLLCRGPRCTARGAEATHEALVRALLAHGLGDDDVLVTVTGCLTPCNHAPVLCLQPDDTWLGAVGPEEARALVPELVEDLRATQPEPGAPARRPRPGRVAPRRG